MKKSFIAFIVFLLLMLFSSQRVSANYQCEVGSPGAETCFTTNFTCSVNEGGYACYSATDGTCPSGCNPYNICDTIQGRPCNDPGFHGAGFMWYCCPDPTPTPVPCNYDCSAWTEGACGGGFPGGVPPTCSADKKPQYNTCTSSVQGCGTYYQNQVCGGSCASGTISASPNPCGASGSTCTSNITWSSSNAPNAKVFVEHVEAGTNTVFNGSPNGINVPATWIIPLHDYIFRVYENGAVGGNVLASVTATGNDTGAPSCTSLTTNASRLKNGDSFSMTATGTDNVSVKQIDGVVSSNTAAPWSMVLLCSNMNLSGTTASFTCPWTVNTSDGSHKLGFNIADSSLNVTNYSSSTNCQNDLCVDNTAPAASIAYLNCLSLGGTATDTPAVCGMVNWVRYSVQRSNDGVNFGDFWNASALSWGAGETLNAVSGTTDWAYSMPGNGYYYKVKVYTDDGINTSGVTATQNIDCRVATPTPTPVPALVCNISPANTTVLTTKTINYEVNVTSGGSGNYSYNAASTDPNCPVVSCGNNPSSTNTRTFTYTAPNTLGLGRVGCTINVKVNDLTNGTSCCAEGTFNVSDFNIRAE